MGLFGGSKSSSTQNTTNNNYQTSIVDNSRSDYWADNSVRNEIFTDNRQEIFTDNRQEITQDFSQRTDIYQDSSQRSEYNGEFAGLNNQGGVFNLTDGGAFALVGDVVGGVAGLTRDTVGQMASLADAGFNLVNNGFSLADSVTARSTNLADSLASYNATVARDSINSSTAITGALLDYASRESEQAKNLSENTTRYALQAVDSISRSDGQQLGIKSLESQKFIFIGLGGLALLAVLMRAK